MAVLTLMQILLALSQIRKFWVSILFDLSDRGVRMGSSRILSGMAAGLLIASPALAAEAITYTYDAKGRLVKVVRSGSVNNNVTIDYEHDKADNRTRLKVTGSPNPPP